MIFYLDDFIQKLTKAHNLIASDQTKAINIIQSVIKDFNPKDEDILYFLNSSVRSGLDSPSKFKEYLIMAIDKAKKNHQTMIHQIKDRKLNNER